MRKRLKMTVIGSVLVLVLSSSQMAAGAGTKGNMDNAETGKSVEEIAEVLAEAAIPYVGDAPGVGNLLYALQDNGIMPEGDFTYELQTDEEPYGLQIYFSEEPADEDTFVERILDGSMLCLTLVENLEEVQCTFPQIYDGKDAQVTYYMDENIVTAMTGTKNLKELKEYAKSPEKLAELLSLELDFQHTEVEISGMEEEDSASVAIIGGADGPTSIFLAGKLG